MATETKYDDALTDLMTEEKEFARVDRPFADGYFLFELETSLQRPSEN